MNIPAPQILPRLPLLCLAWTGVCLLGGLTLLTFSGIHYAACTKAERSMKPLQSELEETTRVHQASLTRLLSFQAQQTQANILEAQDIKFVDEIDQIQRKYRVQLSNWKKLQEALKESNSKWQQALAEVQFAQNELALAGMNPEAITTLLEQLCRQAENQ